MLFIAAHYSGAYSENRGHWISSSTQGVMLDGARLFGTTLFCDITPAVRGGISYHYNKQKYVNNEWSHNHRGLLTFYCVW